MKTIRVLSFAFLVFGCSGGDPDDSDGQEMPDPATQGEGESFSCTGTPENSYDALSRIPPLDLLLDGFNSLESDLRESEENFAEGLAALEARFGLDAQGTLLARTEALVAEIEARVAAVSDSALEVERVAPECRAYSYRWAAEDCSADWLCPSEDCENEDELADVCSNAETAAQNAQSTCTEYIEYSVNARSDVDSSAQAAFTADLLEIERHAKTMLEAFTKIQLLLAGQVGDEVIFAPTPLEDLSSQLNDFDFDSVPERWTAEKNCGVLAVLDLTTNLSQFTSALLVDADAYAHFAEAAESGFGSPE